MENTNNSELTLSQSNQETNVNNTVSNTNDVTVEKMSTILVGITWNKTSDGTPIVCAITKSGNIHTKTTTRSYLTALSGSNGAIAFVKEKLDKGEVEILSGSRITWERTTYSAGTPHERNGQTIILDQEDVIDHILEVDLQPIAEVLLLKYLEEKGGELSALQEKLLQKSFGVEL